MLTFHDEYSPEEIEKFKTEYDELYKNFDWRLAALKRDTVKRLFLEPADTTYLTARWQFFNGLKFEFYWSAFHAIEKYLKAIVLLNNRSILNIKHDIEKGERIVKEIVGKGLYDSIFPQKLTNRIEHILSINDAAKLHYKGPTDFIKNLANNGGPNSRYAMTSVTMFTTDLYCLDLTVFSLRRIAKDISIKKVREHLTSHPEECPNRHAFLEKVAFNPEHSLYETLSKVNYFLVPTPDTNTFLNISGFGLSFSNSAIYNNIVENNVSDNPQNNQVSKELSKWMLDNITLDDSYKDALGKYAPPPIKAD